MLNRSIRRPIELSQHLGIQPIAAIPYMRTSGERRWKRAAVIVVLALIVVGIPLGALRHPYALRAARPAAGRLMETVGLGDGLVTAPAA